jgi:YD repeat-containing protein
MTFQQIEAVIGGALPASARRHRPWWANDARGHAHALAWLGEGYRTEEVDMEGERLIFARAPEHGPGLGHAPSVAGRGMEESMATYTLQDASAQHPMIGALKGLLWIDPALDLTKPALDPDEWDRLLNEKYGKDEHGT